MGFVEGKIDNEKPFRGKVFPKTYLPGGGTSDHDLVELVKDDRASLWEALEQHGALLFRSFRVDSAEDFSSVVDAFGWDEMPYEGAAGRTKKSNRVFTANEIPLDEPITFHHEMSQIKEPCSKIFFFCMEPSPEGGETAIVPSEVVVERMEEELPEVMEKFSQVGMIRILHTKVVEEEDGTKKKIWQRMLKSEDEDEARKRAMEKLSCNSLNFNEDGTADFVFGPMNPIRELGGKRLWFHYIQNYQCFDRDGIVTYGDGSPLPPQVVSVFDRILNENCVDVSWRKGDVLVVDNFRFQHARRPGKPPRSILVSVCK
ncbi:Clavaminate synthase-like protein [Acorus calamus]|uniref:Clavaminate synthase-like protein n=1 Tax=Acorus calamus TaxID=4465 RepID=A0AAV9ED59_ACOCL|nr:Clavaminate synthase-like protein [Acorus calamus]